MWIKVISGVGNRKEKNRKRKRGGITSFPGRAQPFELHRAGLSLGPMVSTAKGANDGVFAATPFLEWGITYIQDSDEMYIGSILIIILMSIRR